MEWHIEAWTQRRSGVRDRVLAGQTIGAAAAEAVDLHTFAELIKKAISATPPEGAGGDYVPRLLEFLGVLQASIREGRQTINPNLTFPPEFYENDDYLDLAEVEASYSNQFLDVAKRLAKAKLTKWLAEAPKKQTEEE